MKRVAGAALAVLLASSAALATDSWTKRSGDNQNTGNAGDQTGYGLTAETVRHLKVRATIPTSEGGIVNATPVVWNDLLVTGDWQGRIYVVDLAAGFKRLALIQTDPTPNSVKTGLQGELGNYIGMQTTPLVAKVTNRTTGLEETRVYVGVTSSEKTFWCLNLTEIAGDRATLQGSDGTGYFCDSPLVEGKSVWPRSLVPPGDEGASALNGSPFFVEDQPICVADCDTAAPVLENRDVIYTPTTGLDCSNGEMWAMDAWSGEILWSFDPVQNDVMGGSKGGVIWTTPAMNGDKTLVYVTTGNCVQQPQVGEMAESMVALDAQTGAVEWYHQRRLIDTADLDIGNGVLVADVPDRCNVVVSSDKDGCIYGYQQTSDIAQPGDLGFDPLRMTQQRVLYRKCFVPGSLNGGFNASNMAFDPTTGLAVQHVAGYPAGHVGADDANAFAIDVCTGKVEWATSNVKNGRDDAMIASGMYFQLSPWTKSQAQPGVAAGYVPVASAVAEMQVVRVDPGDGIVPEHLATVKLNNQPSAGGGGPAIVKGRIYVPTIAGIDVVEPVLQCVEGNPAPVDCTPEDFGNPGAVCCNASAPVAYGNNVFAGPYPQPLAPAPGHLPVVDPNDPYPVLIDHTLKNVLGLPLPE